MSRIDELAALIGAAIQAIDEATSGSTDSTETAEQLATTGEELGAQALLARLQQVKTELEALTDSLRAASTQAQNVQAQVLSLPGGRATTGPTASISRTAGISPTDLPSPPAKPDKPAPVQKKASRLRNLASKAIEMGEDASDAVDFAQNIVTKIDQTLLKAPEPPPVTATSSRSPSSPPTITHAPTDGVEAGTIATAALAVGVFVTGSREVAKKIRRKRSPHEPDEPSR